MAYSTAAELRATFPSGYLQQLTDDASGVCTDDDVLTEAIVAADAEIDLYLARIVMLPLTGDVPRSINRLSMRMARYFLYLRRGLETQVQEDYQACVRQLQAIAAGEVVVIGPDDPDQAQAGVRFYAI